MNNYRKTIIDDLIPYITDKHRLLVCDMGFSVVDKFTEKFPNQITNMGIMEQGTVGIAAGMAMSGMIPIVYCISNFLVFRALEQIRNDVVLQNLNVKFIGTGVNNYFEKLGHSHTCDDDDKIIMETIGMDVYDPYEEYYEPLLSDFITSPKAGYFRV
jgi:transketolase